MSESPHSRKPPRVWKAVRPSEMGLVMSRLVGSLRAAGFTVNRQIDGAINLGRAFGADPSEPGLASLERPMAYRVESEGEILEIPETDLERPPPDR